MLGKNELELFEKICCFIINKDQIPNQIFRLEDNTREFMAELGINFASLQMLQSLGLFFPNAMSRSLNNPEKENLTIEYFDKILNYIPEGENYLKIRLPDFYGLSPVGLQILGHINPKYNEKYYFWLLENYKISNYIISN